ncbi:Uncharacterised protein [Mycobacteroides abscessus subsp. abscessus]|uniref:hypothetical protein n=1 Tax=Mycobacteroides abscessus TaxID=36809 RepID=UPI000927D39F|nr:hypothetical protein [Mycobacteroides abscessus]SIC51759.1 Uncharacterised protein [Mycobacteroides abscessus subsp. abscessus]SID07845.1 Uncharacterised protein [Mycobacteroides abscessus subsp. abscessus]SID34786.1 Uncharacterised protein [Mycobacteroides abscessus subsp. abscessus]SID40790.1 Uncharacterised protein [Mycobacteroides abscessus subsp. abscessus]SKT65974.1 Uncharacterised protein [Mycobacteroides abscessus subsp. abscessus]
MSTVITARYADISVAALIRIAVEAGSLVKVIDQGRLGAVLGSTAFDESVQIAGHLDSQVQMIDQIWQLMRARYRDVAADAGHRRHQSVVLIIDDPAGLLYAADPAPKTPRTRRRVPWWRRLTSGEARDPQLEPDSAHARIGVLRRMGRAVDIHVNVRAPLPDPGFVTTECKDNLAQVRWR